MLRRSCSCSRLRLRRSSSRRQTLPPAAWRHLVHAPLTEADLPRAMDESAEQRPVADGKQQRQQHAAAASKVAAAAEGGRPVVHVSAVDEGEAAH